MVIKIESLRIKNIGCFRGKHQLRLDGSKSGIDIVKGRGGTGKTTLANAVYVCLSGHLQNGFSHDNSMGKYFNPIGVDKEELIESEISVIIYDQEDDQRFRFDRSIQTSQTRWGTVHAVDSLQAREQIENGWSEARSAIALNKVFPLPALSFSILDSETLVGNTNWGGIGLYDLVDRLGDAGARQAAARGAKLPNFYSDKESLKEELIQRINEILTRINNRYNIEHGEGGLIGTHPDCDSDIGVRALSAGQIQVISQTAALVAGEMMPATPPLIGDTLYGRLDHEYRRKMLNVLQGMDRHPLLFLMEPELNGIDIEPRFELTFAEQDPYCQIKSFD